MGFIPSLIGSQLSGATASIFVVPVDLGLEELVGRREVRDFFIGQEGDQTFLEDLKAAFDFAFGWSVGSDAVMNAHGREGSLELGVGVEAVGRGAVAEEGKAIGVKAGRQAVFFQEESEMAKMAPSGVAGNEGSAQDFSGMIVEGQNERRVRFGGPPRMRGRIMLPKLSDGGTLPAAPRLGAGLELRNQLREVLAHISGHHGPGTLELETTRQFIGQQGEI